MGRNFLHFLSRRDSVRTSPSLGTLTDGRSAISQKPALFPTLRTDDSLFARSAAESAFSSPINGPTVRVYPKKLVFYLIAASLSVGDGIPAYLTHTQKEQHSRSSPEKLLLFPCQVTPASGTPPPAPWSLSGTAPACTPHRDPAQATHTAPLYAAAPRFASAEDAHCFHIPPLRQPSPE